MGRLNRGNWDTSLFRAIVTTAQRFRQDRSAIIQQIIDTQTINLIVPVELAKEGADLNREAEHYRIARLN